MRIHKIHETLPRMAKLPYFTRNSLHGLVLRNEQRAAHWTVSMLVCMQEAIKFQHHGRRQRMSAADINHALQIRDFDQIHGFGAADRRRYAALAGATDVFYVEETLHRCEDLIYEPMPHPPVEVGVTMHWFLVKGVKPRIPENAVPRELLEYCRKVRHSKVRLGAQGLLMICS